MQKIMRIIMLIISFIVFPAVLLWVGLSHVAPLFTGEFTKHLGSIEVSYITMAKFIETSWPAFRWQPLWYFGYPIQLLYTPLVPFFEFFTRNLIGWSYSHAYRVLTACAYVVTLVSVYFFVKELTKNSLCGFISSLCYGILPSLLALLYPSVAQDRFAVDIVEPRRFTVLVRWGEGPHIVSIMFLAIAGIFWVRFMRRGGKWSLLWASIFTALTVLTNSVGAWGLVLLVFCLFIGETIETQEKWLMTLKRSLFLGIVSIGCAAFWFSPFFISNFFREGGSAMGFWRNQFPWGWLLILGSLLIYMFIAKKLFNKISGISAAILYFFIMFGLVNTYYSSGIEKLELVPQVLRLTTEVDLALGILTGAIISVLLFFLSKWRIATALATTGIIGATVVIFGPMQLRLAQELPGFTMPLESTGKNLQQTAEYEVVQNLKKLIKGDERAFVPGNYGFYLNYFSDLPQVRGALFQSSIHFWPEHIYYQIVTGDSPRVTLSWLKISNVGWFVMSGPRDIYRDFQAKASKFDEALELVEENVSDRYYRVPLKNNSLAKVVSPEIVNLKVPVNAIDETAIYAYVDELEKSSQKLDFRGVKNGEYAISGDPGDEWILVQMSYASGWQAKDLKGRSLDVKKDPLGFILIKPKEAGMQTITLTYRANFSMWIGWVITGATLIGIIILLIFAKSELFPPKPAVKKEAEVEDE